MKSKLFVVSLFVLCVSACNDKEEAGRTVLVLAADDCENVEEVCAETFPPQCHKICNDDVFAGYDPDCAVSSDGIVTCAEDVCEPLAGNDGDILLCAPAGCSIGQDDDGNGYAVCESPSSPGGTE